MTNESGDREKSGTFLDRLTAEERQRIREIVDAWPPLSQEQRTKLALLWRSAREARRADQDGE